MHGAASLIGELGRQGHPLYGFLRDVRRGVRERSHLHTRHVLTPCLSHLSIREGVSEGAKGGFVSLIDISWS